MGLLQGITIDLINNKMDRMFDLICAMYKDLLETKHEIWEIRNILTTHEERRFAHCPNPTENLNPDLPGVFSTYPKKYSSGDPILLKMLDGDGNVLVGVGYYMASTDRWSIIEPHQHLMKTVGIYIDTKCYKVVEIAPIPFDIS